MRLEHIALWTPDIERLKDFYTVNFGCTSSTKYQNHNKGFSSYFLSFPQGGRLEVMHSTARTGINDESLYGYAHLALALGSEKDVTEFTEKLRGRGIPIESNPRWTGDGYFESVVKDPDGNRIEIVI